MPKAGQAGAVPHRGSRVVRFREVEDRVGLSRTTIWRLERDGKFPLRLKISARTVGWIESEIEAWIAGRVMAR
jgi:prophage regulatory protein